jgi:FkbM family methyltransferase
MASTAALTSFELYAPRSMLARQTKQLANRMGFEISRYRPLAARVAARLEGVPVGVDVGANRGQYATELRRHGYRGQIVSFEPLEEAFAQLATAAARDVNWTCHHIALGASDGEARINVASNLASSSLLEMGAAHRVGAPSVSITGVETVRVARLDDVLADDRPCLLKLDVQGYEGRVLDGAGETLARAELVECELCTAELYAGQTSARALVDRFDDLGFELVDLEPVFRDRTNGRVLALDAVFARARPEPRTG